MGGADSKTKLAELLDSFITARNQQEAAAHQPSGRISPSMLGLCLRRNYYKLKRYPEEPTEAKGVRVFSRGHQIHEYYQNLFAEMNILLAKELLLEDEQLNIKGFVDAIIRTEDGIFVVEIKSANDRSFQQMVANKQPKYEHLVQIQLYMQLLQIGQGIIMVENKNDQDIWFHHVREDIDVVADIWRRIEAINEALKTELPPPREHHKLSFQCRYCPFAASCWEGE